MWPMFWCHTCTIQGCVFSDIHYYQTSWGWDKVIISVIKVKGLFDCNSTFWICSSLMRPDHHATSPMDFSRFEFQVIQMLLHSLSSFDSTSVTDKYCQRLINGGWFLRSRRNGQDVRTLVHVQLRNPMINTLPALSYDSSVNTLLHYSMDRCVWMWPVDELHRSTSVYARVFHDLHVHRNVWCGMKNNTGATHVICHTPTSVPPALNFF